MSAHHTLSIAELRGIFVEEVAAAGGDMLDAYETDRYLVARAKRPALRDVQAGDSLQGGVAIRACDGDVCVNPFVYRLICRNGAIMALALEARRMRASDFLSPTELEDSLRGAVRSCCAEHVLASQVEAIRKTRASRADLAIMMMPFLSRHRDAMGILRMVFERFMGEDDHSTYGLMNAITSVARDTRDPDTRWRLEELGGGVPSFKPAPTRPTGAARGDVAALASSTA